MMDCSFSGLCAMSTEISRRWLGGLLTALALASPGAWATPSEAAFVIGVDTSTAAALQAWADSLDSASDRRFDEQIFTDISPLIDSEDAVKLPTEAVAEE